MEDANETALAEAFERARRDKRVIPDPVKRETYKPNDAGRMVKENE